MPVHFKTVSIFSMFLLSVVLLPNCVDEEKSTSEDELQTVEMDADVEETEGEPGSTCLFKTTALDSLDVVSESIGFTGGDLLGLFEGDQLHHAVYATENDIIEQSPLGGDTILALTVEYDNGEIRDMLGKVPACGNYLEVDVSVTVRTSDTAFAEEATGVLYFYKNEIEEIFTTRLFANLDPNQLEGHFEIQSYIQPSAPEQVLLYLDERVYDDGICQGSIVVMTSEALDDASSSDHFQHVLSWQSVFLL